MKRSTSKPVPSPGRPDKYPAPLMRFLRGNMGSRSSTRSRSSRATSLFLRRKRTSSSSAIEAQQEPTSPKVTCIGQVRVRRSSEPKPALKKASSRRKPASGNTRFCYWVGKPPAVCHVNWLPGSCFRPRWRKWVSFFRCGNIRVRTHSSPKKTGSVTINSDDEGKNSSGGESSCRVYGAGDPPAPPKNALLLTRCRSAPYRTSRFLGSPVETGETEENRGGDAGEEEELGPLEIEKKELVDDAAEEVEGCSNEVEKTATETRTIEKGVEGLVVVLTRSKSGPASVWRERRLEFTLLSSSSSTHSVEN